MMVLMEKLLHLFLPHQTNNHRPKILHHSSLVFYLFFFLLLQISFRAVKFGRSDILGFATNINAEKLLNLTNLARAEQGLNSLTLNTELSSAAYVKATDMFAKNYWAHNAPDGTTPWVFINNSGYGYVFAGENLARDFNNSEGVVAAWMNSPTHRENILRKEYQEIGFAILNGKLNGEDTTLVVQMFGSRTASYTASQKVDVSPPAAQIQGVTAAEVKKQPLVNFFSTSKNLSLFLTLMLVMVLSLDAVIIRRKNLVRIVGHNLAHIVFLLAVFSVIYIAAQGSIL